MNAAGLIDWALVLSGAAGVGGLAVLLAAAGFAYERAGRAGQPLRAVLSGAPYPLALNAGAVLLCAGGAGLAAAGWERALWLALAAAFAYQAWADWKAGR